MHTQKTLSLELGTPSRLRQLFTTVILYPAASSIGLMVVCQTGLALDVQNERVFSMMKHSGLSVHAIRAHAMATCARGSPRLCRPQVLKAWHGGLAVMHSMSGGTESQMRATSSGLSRSARMNGVPKLIACHFCALLQMSTLSTVRQPHFAAATCHPPAPRRRIGRR